MRSSPNDSACSGLAHRLVSHARRLPHAGSHREVLPAHHRLEQRGHGYPPLQVGLPAVLLRRVLQESGAGNTADVGEHTCQRIVHLDIGQADAIQRAQLGFVVAGDVWDHDRPGVTQVQEPRVMLVELPVAPRDKAHGRAPPSLLPRGLVHIGIQFASHVVAHQVRKFPLARYMGVERHCANAQVLGNAPCEAGGGLDDQFVEKTAVERLHCAILGQDVHKRYAGGSEEAGLRGFTIAVEDGTVCGLLGHHRAGRGLRRLPDPGMFALTMLFGQESTMVAVTTVIVDPASMPRVLGAVATWNPLSITASATRELFGSPGYGGGSWIAQHVIEMAVVLPLAITAVFLPLSALAHRNLSR